MLGRTVTRPGRRRPSLYAHGMASGLWRGRYRSGGRGHGDPVLAAPATGPGDRRNL